MIVRAIISLFLFIFTACTTSSENNSCDSSEDGECTDTSRNTDGTTYTCRYTNRYAGPDCKHYIGSKWDDLSEIEANCGSGWVELDASVVEGPCPDSVTVDGVEKLLKGICHAGGGTPEEYDLYSYDGDHATLESACVSFMEGEWEPRGDDSGDADIYQALPEAMAALDSTDKVTVSSQCKDDDCLAEMVKNNETFDFTPVGVEPEAGFVFYPGGKVDPRSYAPSAMAIATQGIFVSLVPMEDYLAINGQLRADDVRAAHPSIGKWFVGGHSLGGAMTAAYGASDGGKTVDGLIIWASIADDEYDLSASDVSVLSIYGELDTGNNADQVKAYAHNLPEDAVYICITGGDHSQFGCYDDPPNATISRAEQQRQIIDATVAFINDPASLSSVECEEK